MKRDQISGVSLLNVLTVIAVGAGLMQFMLRDQDLSVQGLESTNNAAQAQALARGGVTSVAVALRRDAQVSPEVDHLNEPWASAAQDKIALDFGQFEVSITDARGKFDLNALQPAALAEARLFTALLTALELPSVLASQITQVVSKHGPLTDPEVLLDHGIAASDVKRLIPHVTATQTPGPLNLNSVSEPLMVALTRNPAAARVLIARRKGAGELTANDLAALGLPQPQLAGYTSNVFDVRALASVGDARAVLMRRLVRDPDAGAVQSLALP
ncbi:MAG: hypothetical protein AAFQ58_03390 [Pseudomonadota bacterium]